MGLVMLLLIYFNQYFAHSTTPAKDQLNPFIFSEFSLAVIALALGLASTVPGNGSDLRQFGHSHTLPNFCNLADSYGSQPKITVMPFSPNN